MERTSYGEVLMSSCTKIGSHQTSLRSNGGRKRTDIRAARRCDLLKDNLARAIRNSGRYKIRRNFPVPITAASLDLIRRSKGAYLGTSLPSDTNSFDKLTLDLLVIGEQDMWAGGFVVCCEGERSARAMRRLERTVRASELLLRSHLREAGWPLVDTVTVGIIYAESKIANANDIVISQQEIEDRLDIKLEASHLK